MDIMDNGMENSFAAMNRAELIALFEKMLNEEPIESLRRAVESMKVAFYKSQSGEEEGQKDASSEATVIADFEAAEKIAEQAAQIAEQEERQFKALIAEYRKRRDSHLEDMEQQREFNLRAKQQIIEELKELTASDETQTLTFNKFRELQERWRNIGQVPTSNIKDIWEQYNFQIEKFYGVIKINRELRDLDQRKNLEAKVAICERAEALMTSENVIEAFHELQLLHDQWREVGPVDLESKEAIWLRFKEATTIINKRHADYFNSLREEQESNLKLKSEFCDRIEAFVATLPSSHNEWTKCSEELQTIQQEWRKIGFAPKKDNTTVYNRFRTACDAFFMAKREFYAAAKGEQDQNLDAKKRLCEAAELIANSEDWRGASDELIKLQAEWKQIGSVSRRHSDKIWKRFRAACDLLFERKAAHFASESSDQSECLKQKEELLVQMQQVIDNGAVSSIDVIKGFQRKWSEIGFVPIKSKESLQSRYKKVVDQMFTSLRSEEGSRSMSAFRNRIESKGGRGAANERDKLSARLKQLKIDITQLENNLGFFAKSKGAEAMIADVQRKIESGHREIEQIKAKIKMIDIAAREAMSESL